MMALGQSSARFGRWLALLELTLLKITLIIGLAMVSGCVAATGAPEITALSPDLDSRPVKRTDKSENSDSGSPDAQVATATKTANEVDDYKFVSKAKFGLPALNRTFPGTFGFSGNNIDHLLLGAGTAWHSPSVKSAGRVTTSAVLNDGRLFYGDDKGGIHAIAASNGELLWSVWLSDKQRSPGVSTLFADHQIVYAATVGGHLLAISAENGNAIWRKRIQGRINGALRSDDDALLLRVGARDLMAISKKNADLKWRYESPFIINALALADGAVTLAGKDGHYATINAKTGTLSTAKALSQSVAASKLIATKDELILSDEKTISRVQLKSGKLVWSKKTGSDNGIIASGDAVFVAGTDGLLRAFDRKDGALNWFSKLPERRELDGKHKWTRPLLAGGRLHLASNTGYVASFNADDGKLVLLRDFKAPIKSAPIVASGRLFVVTVTGQVFRL